MLEVFSDRVVISSPGLPPPPITLQKLRAGKYRPCSRNPILAQRLSFFIASRNAAAVSDGCTTK
ncbi:MAG TPA: ATP-binding protein [Verrucomicrobiae bacterium]